MSESSVKLPRIDANNQNIISQKQTLTRKNSRKMVQGTPSLRKDSVTGSHVSIASSTATSVTPRERRPSVASSNGTIDRRTSVSSISGVTSGRRPSVTGSRRGSMVGGVPPKKTFLSISKAVGKTALIKRMFGGKQDDLGKIDELPKSPRFSATLSPEAQFAMLKGYEDILITTLGEKYPEHLREFRRCATPTKHIELNEAEEKKKTMANVFRPNRISSSKSDSDALVQSGRLPALPSKTKQLMLTHRFNCAMDIIDAVKTSQGNMTISPRIKNEEKYHSDPVSQYSTWSRVWTREFKL